MSASVQRPSWDEYFLNIATHVATRATCDRKQVGAVITVDNILVSTGYNGAPRGTPDCTEAGHLLVDMGGRPSCVRSVHAEQNAIVNAAHVGVSIRGATLYCTVNPCYDCSKMIVNTGIKSVVVAGQYVSRFSMVDEVQGLFSQVGISYVIFPQST